MVYFRECDFCGKENEQPYNTKFFFTCQYKKTFVCCGDDDCVDKHSRAVCNYEIRIKKFNNYDFYGNTTIYLPRTNGSISIGKITKPYDIPPYSCLEVLENDIMLYTEFFENNSLKCKNILFTTINKFNLHMPLVRIIQSNKIKNLEIMKFRNFQINLENFCLLTNKATRLILISYFKNDGLFSILPKEIISIILMQYYEYK